MHAVRLSDGHCRTDTIFLSFWQRLLHTRDSYSYIGLIQVKFSIIPYKNWFSAENFLAIQHCQNKLKNGMFLIKNAFLRSRSYTLRLFRENNDKLSYFLPPANTENS